MAETSDQGWWEVDVVLRRTAMSIDAQAILGLVRDEVSRTERPTDHRTFDGVRETYSYDIEPPEGSVGVSFWVRADSPHAAVEAAYRLVQKACHEAIGAELPVWDMRLLPIGAVIGRDENPPPTLRATAFRPAGRRPLWQRLLGRP